MPGRYLQKIWCDERGAVTVDWVVLVAAMVGLAAATVAALVDGVSYQAEGIENCLSYDIPTVLGQENLDIEQKLKKIQRWCTDGIH